MTIGARHHTVDRSFAVMAGERLVLRVEQADGTKRCKSVHGVGERADAARFGGDGGVHSHGDVVDDVGVASRSQRRVAVVAGFETGECGVDAVLPLDDAQPGGHEFGGHRHDVVLVQLGVIRLEFDVASHVHAGESVVHGRAKQGVVHVELHLSEMLYLELVHVALRLVIAGCSLEHLSCGTVGVVVHIHQVMVLWVHNLLAGTPDRASAVGGMNATRRGGHGAVAGAVVLECGSRLLCTHSVLDGLEVRIVLAHVNAVHHVSIMVMHHAPSVDIVVVHVHAGVVHSR